MARVSLLQAWRPRRLHAQIATLGALLLVSVIGVHTWYTVESETELASAALENEVRALTANIAAASASLLVTRRYSELEELLARTAEFPDVVRLQISDRTGRVLADVMRDSEGVPHRRFEATPIAPPALNRLYRARIDDHLVMWQPVEAGTPVGWVRVEYSLRYLSDLRHRILRHSLLVGMVSTVLSVLLLVLFLRRPARAVERATEFAARLDAQRGQSFKADRGIQEIEALGEALDHVSHKLAEQEQALSAARQRLEAVLNHAIDGILTLDERGHIETANPAAERIFNYSAAELRGLPLSRLVPDLQFSDEDPDSDPPPPLVGGVRLELMAYRKDGSPFPLILGLTEMPTSDGRVLVGIARDITEQKRLDRMKSDFIAAVSHELRTPLTTIHGALGLLATNEVEGIQGQAHKVAEMAYKNSARLTRLINDILDFESMEAGSMRYSMETVALMPLIEQAIEANQAAARQQRVGLVLQPGPSDAQVLVDPTRLVQALSNLLGNAVRLSPPDDNVEIDVQRVEGRLRISVTDHGPGIPEQYRPYLFEKFVQVDASDIRYKAGAGLGLSIARAIVQQLGGEIDYVSTPNVRTTFIVELPELLPT